MRIINLFSKSVLTISLLSITGLAMAHEGHEMPDESNKVATSTMAINGNVPMDHSQMVQMNNPSPKIDHSQHQMASPDSNDTEPNASHDMHDHRKEHGGQVYQRVTIDNAWMVDKDGEGTLDSSFELRLGTDENKLFLKGSSSKAESSKAEYDLSALYSRNIAAFWDVQAGVRYTDDPERETDQQQFDAALGLHGLAQYFFETDAYLYFGQDSRVSFSLETSRDLLLTQKLILQPYLDLNVVFSDDSRYAKKSGLNSITTGLETRYEITKKVMPYVSVAYAYAKGNKETDWQIATDSKNGWLYGAGLRFIF